MYANIVLVRLTFSMWFDRIKVMFDFIEGLIRVK